MAAGWSGYWIDAARTLRMQDDAVIILDDQGFTFANVVKSTVFMTNLGDFAAMNEVYGRPEYFGANPPARSTVQRVFA